MAFRFTFRSQQEPKPEEAAEKFCKAIRKKLIWLDSATLNPKSLRLARIVIHALRDEYNRERGTGFGSELLQLADRVCRKASEIVNFNPNDWNNYRRGQQFRRLDETLIAFETALWRSKQPPKPPDNIIPLRPDSGPQR